MLTKFLLGATLLFSATIAAPVEASTAAAASAPGQDILSATANRLSGTIARLNALPSNPNLAAGITQEISSISQGIDAAASQVENGPNLGWDTALAFAPVLTLLIASAKSVTSDIQANARLFNPQAMAQAMDLNYRAVSHLKSAFDRKVPDTFQWIVSGLAAGTLVDLARTRDSFATAGYSAPAPYQAPYSATAPYGAAPVGYPAQVPAPYPAQYPAQYPAAVPAYSPY